MKKNLMSQRPFALQWGVWATAYLTVALGMTAVSSAATMSTVPMTILGQGPVGDGAVSTIIRDDRGVTIAVHTENLDPGPHTVWALVWNSPENCTSGNGDVTCIPPPNGSDPPESVMFGAGGIVGASGRGNFGFRINVGDTSDVRAGAVQAGLTDALGAEIHVIVVDHQEIIPGEIQEQLRNPGDSGCGGPCPVAQVAAHVPGADDAVGAQLEAIHALLGRLALRHGLNPGR